jgi:hypothetical protein
MTVVVAVGNDGVVIGPYNYCFIKNQKKAIIDGVITKLF